MRLKWRSHRLHAALAVHLYDGASKAKQREVTRYALEHGLDVRVVPASEFPSWWYPGSTRLVVYTPKHFSAMLGAA